MIAGGRRRFAPSLIPPLPTLLPVSRISSPTPIIKGMLRGSRHQDPDVLCACRIWGIRGRAGYLPPGSQLCPARGSSQSEFEGVRFIAPPRHPSTSHLSNARIFGKYNRYIWASLGGAMNLTPSNSLCELPRAGHNCDPGGR